MNGGWFLSGKIKCKKVSVQKLAARLGSMKQFKITGLILQMPG